MEDNNLQPYINQDVQEVAKLVEYLDRNNKVKRGYKAEILPNLCDIYLQAEKDGKIKKNQHKLVDIAEIMIRSLAKVGITALVDEATGYQAEIKLVNRSLKFQIVDLLQENNPELEGEQLKAKVNEIYNMVSGK